MRVLGIDPGLTRCGVGVVEGSIGRPLSLVDVGVVRTGADLPIEQRLCLIEAGLEQWLDATRPDAVAVERVFSQHNVKTVMGTAQASGIALLVAARRGLPVALHTPSEVKAAVTGSGRADKAQVGAMVTRLLRLTEIPKPADAADALALAICHIWRGGATQPARGGGGSPHGPARHVDRSAPMIAFVRGRVADVGLTSAVLEVGGVGLELQCTPNTIAGLRIGAEATLPTSMVVREDSLTLFGFVDDDEKQMFELVQTASGVGPKLAQAMLAVHRPEVLRRAVSSDDVKTLTTVPGIGQKGAQRIILELRDRIGLPMTTSVQQPPTAGSQGSNWQEQVQAGLVGLGWTAREADQAVSAVAPEAEQMPTPDVARLLRAALRTLSKA